VLNYGKLPEGPSIAAAKRTAEEAATNSNVMIEDQAAMILADERTPILI
jgi:hypothetical protein